MPERRSRHERMQLQPENATSIFDLAKTAQARVKGLEDTFIVSKKPTQYVAFKRIESYEPSSPSSSDLSESEEWFSDVCDDLKEDENRIRQAHRAAALAALEGRAAPVEEFEPIFRSARMDYDDHIEAEHGQLYTFQPCPNRPAAHFQRSLSIWEDQLAAEEAEIANEECLKLCAITPQQSSRSGVNDVLEWLNSDSPVDLLHRRPIFYDQPSPAADEFWGEMTLEQLNAIA